MTYYVELTMNLNGAKGYLKRGQFHATERSPYMSEQQALRASIKAMADFAERNMDIRAEAKAW